MQNSDNAHGEATYYTVGIKWPKPVNKFNRCKCREHLVLTQGPCRCHMLLVHVTLIDINRLIAFLCSTNDRCCMHASNLIHRCLCVMHALIEHICCTLLLQAKLCNLTHSSNASNRQDLVTFAMCAMPRPTETNKQRQERVEQGLTSQDVNQEVPNKPKADLKVICCLLPLCHAMPLCHAAVPCRWVVLRTYHNTTQPASQPASQPSIDDGPQER